MDKDTYKKLEQRIGRVHLKQRLGIETDFEKKVIGQGYNFFHIENWYSLHSLMRLVLNITGMRNRGRRNALKIDICHNDVPIANLPASFDGFTLLHLSDLHLDMYEPLPHVLIEHIRQVDYDVCVITGDIRAMTYGSYAATLESLKRVNTHISKPVYCVLGNHDSIKMVSGIESLGIQVLLNEYTKLDRDGDSIYLAGIDDPHYFCVDNIEKASHDIPPEAPSILLSHSPETYRRAAHSDYDLMLSGHTHGGQVCLPGGMPVMTNARCPRSICSGAWKYNNMQGYTSRGSGVSVLDVRFNCPPEITLHHLRKA